MKTLDSVKDEKHIKTSEAILEALHAYAPSIMTEGISEDDVKAKNEAIDNAFYNWLYCHDASVIRSTVDVAICVSRKTEASMS